MDEAVGKGRSLAVNYLKIVIPALSDFVSSIFAHIALFFLPASLFLMLRAGTIAFTGFLSSRILKRVFTP